MGERWPVGPSIDKKKFHHCFWGPVGKNSHFFGFFSVSTLPSADKKHSAKLALPSLFLASAVRRVLHSTNHLPSVLCLLLSVSGTRQTQGVR